MFLVVGLGNPGSRYSGTRHNIGFLAVEFLARGAEWRQKFQGEIAQIELGGQKLTLLKPLTYMNESGQSVGPAAKFFKVEPRDVVVVHDELDLPLGTVRIKQGGGDAGHNGLRSIRAHLGTGDFIRIRLGIGRPPPTFRGEIADYVLQGFPLADQGARDTMAEQAALALELIVERGLSSAMNTVNQRK
ncbi:MAG: aminoacyl-tRNA hydrolase [Polyangiaceae bacterium]|nr:aminoacyl-tRNA hydrolase [Polyangiaceae bacterium]